LHVQEPHRLSLDEPSRTPLHERCAYYYTIELEMELMGKRIGMCSCDRLESWRLTG
jgi:hypothetical protein